MIMLCNVGIECMRYMHGDLKGPTIPVQEKIMEEGQLGVFIWETVYWCIDLSVIALAKDLW